MSYFDDAIKQESQRRLAESIEKHRQELASQIHDAPIISSFRDNITSTFLLFSEMAREAPGLFRAFGNPIEGKRGTVFHSVSISETGRLEYFYKTGEDIKRTPILQYSPFDEKAFLERYFTDDHPCFKVVEDKLSINSGEFFSKCSNNPVPGVKPPNIQNEFGFFLLSSSYYDNDCDSYHGYSLLYHLARRTYTYSVSEPNWNNQFLPKAIVIEDLRPKAETVELLKNDFIMMAKGDSISIKIIS